MHASSTRQPAAQALLAEFATLPSLVACYVPRHCLAACLEHRVPGSPKRIGVLLSGGNVAPELVASLVGVCRRAKTMVVAEGVESEAEAALLMDLGCELLQGYYFGKPGPLPRP
jgi:hypothetical protein